MLLVTGADGQLGSELRSILPKDKSLFMNRTQLDITDLTAVQQLMLQHKFAFIINCAAYTAVDKAEDHKIQAHLINVIGAKNLANTGIPLVHISTDYVFDGNSCRPYVETDITNPLSVYGSTKLASENVVLENADTAIIIRTSWVYSKFGNNFVKTILRLASERKSLGIVNDQIGTPTSAAELAQIIVNIIPNVAKGTKEIYHFSNEGVCSWYNFAKLIVEKTQLPCEIIPIGSKDYPQKAKRPSYSVLNKQKIKSDFNIKITSWEECIFNF